jgi:ubiquinone/menaquinone biosynthesis C-methylase UbiE
MHLYMLQPFTTLAVHTAAHQRKRILEVACGSGMHSLYLAKTMLARGSALVSCDISEEMIKLTKSKFEDPHSEYFIVPGNKA